MQRITTIHGFLFLTMLGLLLFLTPLGLSYAGDKRVGSETCRHCHESQYSSWKAGPHAKAFASLDLTKRQDAKCYSCHATDKNAVEKGIECESCHGEGEHYARDYIMKDKELARELGLKKGDMNVCLACHRGERTKVRPFDAAKDWHLLPHAKSGENRLEAKSEKK